MEKKIIQKVLVYPTYQKSFEDIAEFMNNEIKDGWRVVTCLNNPGSVLVVYEKETTRGA